VRILLVGLSHLLSDIITAVFAGLPDIAVAGYVNDIKDLESEIRLQNADAVITQASQPGNADLFLPLLRSFPELKVVAIDNSGKEGFVHQLRPWSYCLVELSTETLQAALTGGTEKLH
jgi:hypothetical protein